MAFCSGNHAYPKLAMFIDGEWVEEGGRRTHKVVNPATGDTIGEMPLADATDLDRALDASQRGFKIWRNSSADERSQVLAGAARLMRERVEQIAANETLEQGKLFIEARNEILATAGLFDFYAGEAKRKYGRVLVRPSGARSLVVKEPIGPVAAFTPWNFPFDSPGRKLGAPIAAGCSVILKPAEEAPASAIAIIQALLDAGLPKEVVQIVCGIPADVSRHLLASPIIKKASFTGSTEVGKHLMRLCADTMKRTTMELGGHAPVIVFDDADIDKAVNILVATKYRNAGQVCVSPTRFYVQDGVYDRFVSAFSARVEKINIGNGLDEKSMMGPTANPRRPVALESLISDAVSHGARVRVGGERSEGKGFFFRPTVLSEVPAQARIMNEEPFGPIALTARFSTFDEVVEQANRLPYGLAAFAFTENGRRANLIADAIEAGMVGINTTVIRYADSPFQGVKESGHGSEDGPEGVDACLITKSIHQV